MSQETCSSCGEKCKLFKITYNPRTVTCHNCENPSRDTMGFIINRKRIPLLPAWKQQAMETQSRTIRYPTINPWSK